MVKRHATAKYFCKYGRNMVMSSGTGDASRPLVRSRIWVSGRVQGVAYRAFAYEAACRMGLRGGVRNLDDGRVEIEVEGDRPTAEAFLELLRTGPPLARVDDVQVEWNAPTGTWERFQIWY